MATIALGDVGAVPYYSKLRTVDLWSLTDRYIIDTKYQQGATANLNQRIRDYVLDQRRPDFIVLGGSRDKDGTLNNLSPYDLYNDERFKSRYGYLATWVYVDGYLLLLYQRQDLRMALP
jgi:hypothetical protein